MNIFWLLLGGCPFFGWWCVMVDIFWLVVGDGRCWGIFFDWWWVLMLVDGGGW